MAFAGRTDICCNHDQYKLIEAPNMQSNARKYLMGGTPRLETVQHGVTYSNLDDLDTEISCCVENGIYRFRVNTHLVDIDQRAPKQGEVSVKIDYTYSEQGVMMEVEQCPDSVYLVLPVIASPEEVVKVTRQEAFITKNNGILGITCKAGRLEVAATDDDGRIFNPVPGFSFVPLRIKPDDANKKIKIILFFR